MILIKLQGGLGNQMFQYVFAYILAKKNATNIVIDNCIYSITEKIDGYTPRTFELSIFDNVYNFAKETDFLLFNKLSLINRIKKKIGLNYPEKFYEMRFNYSHELNSLKSPVYVIGYFQSYKYFTGYESIIKHIFDFPVEQLSQRNLDLIPILKENCIAIHVRRGDYVTDTVTNSVHGSCSIEYYTKAISYISSEIQNPTLVFFSDDLEWVKRNFENVSFSKIFIGHNTGKNSWIDMFLMSICSHNIIANSSFSWWGAWLNNNPQKIVVAPENWFQTREIDINSIIPQEWIKM